mgnify:FL=1
MATVAGAISYPLYLLHQHAGYMLIDRFSAKLGAWPAFALTAIAVTLVAAATSELIERPLRPAIIRQLSRLADALGHSFKSAKSFGLKKEGRH